MGALDDLSKLTAAGSVTSTPTSVIGAYFSPVVTRERFAEMVGLPVGVIIGWCNKGLIPTVAIGKYSLISVELLRKRCLDREFE